MGKNTAINWCDHTANFWHGCFKVSDGCKFCYAEALSKRYGRDIWGPPATTPRMRVKSIWKDLLKWDYEAFEAGERRRVFVSSMSDFLEDHPMVAPWRTEAIQLLEHLKSLDVLLLTKRPENALLFLRSWFENWPAHVWFGTSVEDQKTADYRIPLLPPRLAPVTFLSVEPMLEEIIFPKAFRRVNWVIVGGESGPNCRPFEWNWARSVAIQCAYTDAAFWMKQGGGHPNKRHELSDIPKDLRIRDLPRKGGR